jgi:signal transduction histidine kinase
VNLHRSGSPRDAALPDVLDRLRAATSNLSGGREPHEVAARAVDLALELTQSSRAVLALGGGSSRGPAQYFSRGAANPQALKGGDLEQLLASVRGEAGWAAGAELRAGGHVLGAMAVARASNYTEAERQAFSIFAHQVAAALDSAGLVAQLTKVDSARQMLLKNITTVVDKERKRFVSELHDDALQKLTAAELQVARLAPGGTIDPLSLDELKRLLEQTENALRRLVFEVRPPSLEGPDGLAQSIRDRVAMLAASGISNELELNLPDELSPDLTTMIFRQVAEAIGNVERHSKATLIKVSVRVADGGVLGVIQDNGQGFVVAERSNVPGHLGLLALRERALMAGGRYKIESEPGSGTRIEFWVPLGQ